MDSSFIDDLLQLSRISRAELRRASVSLSTIAGDGVNVTDTSGFVTRLQENGFYARWRREFGDKAWTLLEQKRRRPLP